MSRSDSFVLYNESAPYIMSSTPYCYKNYDLRFEPNKFKVSLKYNQKLKQSDTLFVSFVPDIEPDLSNPITSNLEYKNYTEQYTIKGKNYTMDYSIVTFDLELDSICTFITTMPYQFTLHGLCGKDTNIPIADF